MKNRLDLLQNAKLIAATTTGASKLEDLIKKFSPKVIIVEEAGQVSLHSALAVAYLPS